MTEDEDDKDECPTCEREMHYPSDHHLVPKARGGDNKKENRVLICEDCHVYLHALFSNKQLEKEYNSLESLIKDERFQRAIKFLRKQNPAVRIKTKRAKKGRKKGN